VSDNFISFYQENLKARGLLDSLQVCVCTHYTFWRRYESSDEEKEDKDAEYDAQPLD
jgi:hypothetical protein